MAVFGIKGGVRPDHLDLGAIVEERVRVMLRVTVRVTVMVRITVRVTVRVTIRNLGVIVDDASKG